jgi:hypothetical protein
LRIARTCRIASRLSFLAVLTLSSRLAHGQDTIRGRLVGAKCLPVLPDTVKRVLQAREPDFVLWKRPFDMTCARAPYGAMGDFNGDGVRDVVLNGRNSGEALVVALLSGPAGFSLHDVRRAPLVREDGRPRDWGFHFIYYVPKGKYSPNCWQEVTRPEVVVETDAFWISQDDHGGPLVYFRDGRFNFFPWMGQC